MGNQLTAIAPSQVLPVEQYLNEFSHFSYQENLGSTRFFKVIKAKTKEGSIVIKVFVLHDPSLQLKEYETQLEEVKIKLELSLHCKPFQSVVKSDKAVLLCRQFIQHSLYDRISTRPFFKTIEKKWISFLLLLAIEESHKLNIYHGDIKSENILITSWNWVLLSDFAPFKPTFLPDNNPTDFSFFFDTSRRRTCYIAPERFINSSSINSNDPSCDNSFDLSSSSLLSGNLTEAMDVFSTGCVLIELFTEGIVPFDLSQLLAYRVGEYSPENVINLIKDKGIRTLASHMTQKEPNNRYSIEKYLNDHRGSTFPECFYYFLKPYTQRFLATPVLRADERIARIRRDFDLIVNNIHKQTSKSETNFLIILSLITSSVRKLKFADSKLTALQLLRKCSAFVSSEIILDRILPYVIFFIEDKYPTVRCQTISILIQCLRLVTCVSESEANIFTEYILPLTSQLISDRDLSVRVTLAQNISFLAEESMRFLEMAQSEIIFEKEKLNKNKTSQKDSFSSHSSYDCEISTLQDLMEQKVVSMLGDKNNAVKKSLLVNGINKLCIFFGRQKANDIIFSHMITYLNDKQDWQLRATFFDAVVGVVSFLGWQASGILEPLIQQGLKDSEEFVVEKALACFCSLLDIGLMKKKLILEVIQEVLPLLLHPNFWIRRKVVGIIIVLCKKMEICDFYCYIIPLLSKYFPKSVVDFSDEMILMETLKKPLPRQVFNHLTNNPALLEGFINFIQTQNLFQNRNENDPNFMFLKKLQSQGLTEVDLSSIGLISKNLLSCIKMRYLQAAFKRQNQNHEKFNGIINLSFLNNEASTICNQSSLSDDSFDSKYKKNSNKINSSEGIINEEWKQMFGSSDKFKYSTGGKVNLPTFLNLETQDTSQDKENYKITEAWCKENLFHIEENMRKEFSTTAFNGRKLVKKVLLSKWRPSGVMIAHLHEHRGAVNRLRISDKRYTVASCSNDGSVKIWDCLKMSGKSLVNKSRVTYAKQPGQIKTICFCDNSQSVASASDTGSLHIFKIDSSQGKLKAFRTKDIDINSKGLVVDMTTIDGEAQNIISFATVHGLMFGWDLRMNRYAWQVETNPELGLINSIDVHNQLGWVVVGTSNGVHSLWDMRFLLPINQLTHPAGARVKRVVVDQLSPSTAISATQGNNELTIWDVETNTRNKVLWGSPCPVLTYNVPTRHSFSGFYYHPEFIITAGSDMRLRYWDLIQPSQSFIITGSSNDSRDVGSLVSYNARLVEATQVFYESYNNCKQPSCPPVNETSYLHDVSTGHRDAISDLVVCLLPSSTSSSPPLHFILTSSRDGVIKMWK